MTEEKREGGGRICVQRELSSKAAACWFMFMFMFMLACWLVVVVLVFPSCSIPITLRVGVDHLQVV